MRTLYIILTLATLKLSAQQYISFTYDAAGNRVKRELVVGAFRKEKVDTLSDQLGTQSFHIYPNPTATSVEVVLDSKDGVSADREYTLLSLTGTLIASKTSQTLRNSFDLSAQPSGIYLLRIRQKDEEVVWRIVKE